MAFRQLLKNRYLRLTTFKWIIGVASFDREVILGGRKRLKIHWIKGNPKDSWFADPFILSEEENHLQILVEQFFYANHKGRISKLVVNRHNWRIEQIIPLIDIPTHLSFPAYFREGGKVFIYPESSQSGKLTLYEYDEKTDQATAVKVLSGYPLADAVLFELDGKQSLLATTAPRDNGSVLDVYPCTDDPGAGPEARVTFKTRVARNAGLPFRLDGRLIRPAQDCSRSYGSCVVLQEMAVKDGNLAFKEIQRLHSPLFNYREAFHTFNVFEDRFIAVDAEGFRYGLFAQLIYHIRESFR